MDPRIDEILNLFVLPKLNEIEELLISRVHDVMKVHLLEKGSMCYKGKVRTLEQDTQPLINTLLLMSADFLAFVVRKLIDPNNANVYKDFKVNRKNMDMVEIFNAM